MTCMGEKLTHEEVNDMFEEAGVKEGGYIYFERKLIRGKLVKRIQVGKKKRTYVDLGMTAGTYRTMV